MGPFNFLGSMQNGLNQYFAPELSQANNTLSQFFPSKSLNYRMDSSPKVPDIHPLMTGGQQQQPMQPQQIPMPQQPIQPQEQPVSIEEVLLALFGPQIFAGGGFSG